MYCARQGFAREIYFRAFFSNWLIFLRQDLEYKEIESREVSINILAMQHSVKDQFVFYN